MRRWVPIAALSLILLALPVWAQRGGGGHASGGGHFGGGGSHAVSHSSFAGHSSGSFHSGSFNHSGGGYGYHGGGVRIRVGGGYGRGFYGRRGYYPWGYPYWGLYGDPFFYDDDNQSDDQDSYSGASYYQPPFNPPPENGRLRSDLDTLNGKIDQLQATVEARQKPAQEPETALVFRDQHVEQVRNYAISGGTLWVLNDHQTGKKIPLAQLDIPATIKMNDDRGVDFQVPGPSLQLQIMR